MPPIRQSLDIRNQNKLQNVFDKNIENQKTSPQPLETDQIIEKFTEKIDKKKLKNQRKQNYKLKRQGSDSVLIHNQSIETLPSLRNEAQENQVTIRVDKFIEADVMNKLIEKAFDDSSNHQIIDESILLQIRNYNKRFLTKKQIDQVSIVENRNQMLMEEKELDKLKLVNIPKIQTIYSHRAKPSQLRFNIVQNYKKELLGLEEGIQKEISNQVENLRKKYQDYVNKERILRNKDAMNEQLIKSYSKRSPSSSKISRNIKSAFSSIKLDSQHDKRQTQSRITESSTNVVDEIKRKLAEQVKKKQLQNLQTGKKMIKQESKYDKKAETSFQRPEPLADHQEKERLIDKYIFELDVRQPSDSILHEVLGQKYKNVISEVRSSFNDSQPCNQMGLIIQEIPSAEQVFLDKKKHNEIIYSYLDQLESAQQDANKFQISTNISGRLGSKFSPMKQPQKNGEFMAQQFQQQHKQVLTNFNQQQSRKELQFSELKQKEAIQKRTDQFDLETLDKLFFLECNNKRLTDFRLFSLVDVQNKTFIIQEQKILNHHVESAFISIKKMLSSTSSGKINTEINQVVISKNYLSDDDLCKLLKTINYIKKINFILISSEELGFKSLKQLRKFLSREKIKNLHELVIRDPKNLRQDYLARFLDGTILLSTDEYLDYLNHLKNPEINKQKKSNKNKKVEKEKLPVYINPNENELTLQRLLLQKIRIDKRIINSLEIFLNSCKFLKELEISYSTFLSSDFIILVSIISKNRHLSSICLQYNILFNFINKIEEEQVAIEPLQVLNVQSSLASLQSEQTQSFESPSEKKDKVTEYDLSQEQSLINSLQEILKYNKQLTHLDLSGWGITTSMAKQIFKCLKNAMSLQTIHLDGNPFVIDTSAPVAIATLIRGKVNYVNNYKKKRASDGNELEFNDEKAYLNEIKKELKNINIPKIEKDESLLAQKYFMIQRILGQKLDMPGSGQWLVSCNHPKTQPVNQSSNILDSLQNPIHDNCKCLRCHHQRYAIIFWSETIAKRLQREESKEAKLIYQMVIGKQNSNQNNIYYKVNAQQFFQENKANNINIQSQSLNASLLFNSLQAQFNKAFKRSLENLSSVIERDNMTKTQQKLIKNQNSPGSRYENSPEQSISQSRAPSQLQEEGQLILNQSSYLEFDESVNYQQIQSPSIISEKQQSAIEKLENQQSYLLDSPSHIAPQFFCQEYGWSSQKMENLFSFCQRIDPETWKEPDYINEMIQLGRITVQEAANGKLNKMQKFRLQEEKQKFINSFKLNWVNSIQKAIKYKQIHLINFELAKQIIIDMYPYENFYILPVFLPPGKHSCIIQQEINEVQSHVTYLETIVKPRMEPVYRFTKKPKKKAKRQPAFEKNGSIFAAWRDKEDLFEKNDFLRWKLTKFVRNLTDQLDTQQFFQNNIQAIKEIYYNIQASSPSYPAITQVLFGSFCIQSNIVDKDFSLSTVDRLFIASNYDQNEDKGDNSSTELLRYEFLEILVRIAKQKFMESKQTTSYYTALQTLLSLIQSNYPLKSWMQFRETKIWNVQINRLLSLNQSGIKRAYIVLAQPNRYVTFPDIAYKMQRLLNMTEKDAIFYYGMSLMPIVQEQHEGEKYLYMEFVEFLEYICRLGCEKFDFQKEEGHFGDQQMDSVFNSVEIRIEKMVSLLLGKILNEQIIREENIDDDFTESDNDY